jgi:YD repeat-containing protein
LIETAWNVTAETSYDYDELDNLLTVTDAAINVKTMTYNGTLRTG